MYTLSMTRIRHLYLSAGHNYFGHHGKPASSHPMVEVEAVRCLTGRGLEGDRFFDYKNNYKGQITFFSWEVFQELSDGLDVWHQPPSVLRRNVITEGLALNDLIGSEFEIQGVRFAGTQECSPCYWMNQAFAPGAEQMLETRGGLRARILSDGWLRRTD